MYVVLTGAKKNLGDFLITARAKALLRHFRPEHELVQLPSWESLEPHRDTLAKASAAILMGGPGYQPGFHGTVYGLVDDVSTLPCPLVPLGLGWKGIPGDAQTLAEYRFTERSRLALEFASRNPSGLGCRDYLTCKVLERHGLKGATMTGCPVWYELGSIGQDMVLPSRVRRVVFTPAQDPRFHDQSIAVAKELAGLFPDAEKICSFHRGLAEKDNFTPSADLDAAQRIARETADFGFESRDVSGDLERIQFYDESDLHVGYRVHAHVYFLSKRRPSLLIHEDGRGIGQSHALDVAGVDAFRRTTYGKASPRLPSTVKRKVKKLGWATYEADPTVPSRVRERVKQDVDAGFSRFAGVGRMLDRHFSVMQRFIEALP